MRLADAPPSRASRFAVLLSMTTLLLALAAGAAWSEECRENHTDGPGLLASGDIRLQLQNGAVTETADPGGGGGTVLRAHAGPRRSGRVGKAALIVPIGTMGPGAVISAEANFYFAEGTPLNSIHLMDLECKFCGQDHNPGLRLYLRHGRLRIDRSKINGGHAWTNGSAPEIVPDRWHRIRWELTLGTDNSQGLSVVTLNGQTVLRNQGRTRPDVPEEQAAIDRLQIGITANSNDRAATGYLDGLTLCVSQ